jgi:uncharacterized protein (TIGR00251 family)
MSCATEQPGGVVLTIRAKPKASRSRVLAVRNEAIEVAIAAAPVDGKANVELIRTLADYFGVPRSAVELVSGNSGRTKRVRLRGLGLPEVARRLAELPA